MKIVQHEQTIETEKNSGKNPKDECTAVHKRITDRPLMDRYTLVLKRKIAY